MAKKKGKGKAITVEKTMVIDDFDELAEHVNDNRKRRHLVLINEPHVAKIPQAVIFADGKRIVLNAD